MARELHGCPGWEGIVTASSATIQDPLLFLILRPLSTCVEASTLTILSSP